MDKQTSLTINYYSGPALIKSTINEIIILSNSGFFSALMTMMETNLEGFVDTATQLVLANPQRNSV